MFDEIKLAMLAAIVGLGLPMCSNNTPTPVFDINASIYTAIRQNSSADALFVSAGANDVGDERCDVRIFRMAYDTVDGAGQATTSSGVFMLPQGDDPACNGPLPVVMYAHGTVHDIDYDLSKFLTDPSNAATYEAMILLATYAANGYAVIAPNYAGYADSTLDYHPYLDEAQQSQEMLDALNNIRSNANVIGANLSDELFLTGVSQGGYVAMAAHKAFESAGEKVTASLPIAGPYAMLDFVDTIMAGYPNNGVTIFAPLYLTALQRAHGIYNDPLEIYTENYANTVENALPREGGFLAAVAAGEIPRNKIFGGEPPEDAESWQIASFGPNHLLSTSIREEYLADVSANPTEPAHPIRAVIADGDMRDEWAPDAPLLMCGASDDNIVYHSSADLMEQHWTGLPTGLVTNLDLNDAPVGDFADIMQAFQNQNILDGGQIHTASATYCSLVGLRYFDTMRNMP